jgi:hypothetical protein
MVLILAAPPRSCGITALIRATLGAAIQYVTDLKPTTFQKATRFSSR